jgi:predicted small secreted protein
MRRIVLVVVAAAAALSMTACNTIEGAGRDVKAAGAAVEKSAK